MVFRLSPLRLRGGAAPPSCRQDRQAAQVRAHGPTHRDRWAQDRHDVLGRGVVREPRGVQRLRQPPAPGPDLRAQRFGHRPADRRGSSARRRQWIGLLRRRHRDRAAGYAALEGDQAAVRRQARLDGRAAAGRDLQERHGGGDRPAHGSVSFAARDLAALLVPGLGEHVQARRGRAVRRGGAAGP